MRKTVTSFVIVCILSLFSTPGLFAGEQQTNQKTKKPYEIGVIILSREHIFFNIIEDNMEARATERSVSLICVDGQLDSNIQYNQVQDFITRKVDAIVIAPASNAGSAPAIKLAEDAKIPIFTLNLSSDGQPTAHVGTDDLLGGKIAADFAAVVLGGKGTAAIITVEHFPTCKAREKGFVETIAKYPGIEIVAIGDYLGDANKAFSVTQDFLTNHPDLDLIFATGDPAAVGALSAIKAGGKRTRIIGYDGNPEAVAAIKDPEDGQHWIADVAQDAKGTGIRMVDVVVDYLDTGRTDSLIEIDPYLVDMEYIKAKGL